MMKKLIPIVLILLIASNAISQVAINDDGSSTNASSMLHIKSTDKGMLIPRMTENQRDAISSPAYGLLVFVTTDSTFYFYEGSNWTKLGMGSSGWHEHNNKIYTDSLHSVSIGDTAGSAVFQVKTDEATGIYSPDVCIGGTASANEEYPGQPAANAFDNSLSTYWSNNNNLPSWLQYDFGDGNERVIARYRIFFSAAGYDASPDVWQFQASDDASTWTTLDSRTGQGWTIDEWKTYTFSNEERFRYYRLLISDNKGTANNYVSINEVQMNEMTYEKHSTLVVSGNAVGIGTESPSSTLHINGTLLYEDGNESSGWIMVSDASGNATWTDGANVNAGGWTVNGNHIYNTSDSVGIGTATPGAPLEVSGRISQIGIGNSVFLGEGAGENDDFTNGCVFIGKNAGYSNDSGNDHVAIGNGAFYSSANSSRNTGIGQNSLYSTSTGDGNTAVGYSSLSGNTGGSYNVAIGYMTMSNNSTGSDNIAIGLSAMNNNSAGDYNVSIGRNSLYTSNSTSKNIAIGYQSLYNNDADNLVAIGHEAMYSNTSGTGNIALGHHSLYTNQLGADNTALGDSALYYNTSNANTAVGSSSLQNNTASGLSAFGASSLESNTTGSENCAFGYNALKNNTTGDENSAFGYGALESSTTTQSNTAIGYMHSMYQQGL